MIRLWREEVVLDHMYDFDYTLYRLSFDPLIAVDREKRSVKVPVALDGKKYTVEVSATGTVERPSFIIEGQDKQHEDELLTHIHHLFQWNVNLEEVQEHFKRTNLAALFSKFPGTPIVKEFDLYYCLMKNIIHQQLNMKFAYVLSTRFIESFGEMHDGVWFYPTPERIAEIEIEQLRGMQFSGRKSEYVIHTSQRIAGGEVDLESISDKSDEEVFEALLPIRGIGPWTVENWLLFALGRPNLFPKADIGIQNAVKRFFGMDRKPSKEELADLSKDWEPYLSYASLTLWRSIE